MAKIRNLVISLFLLIAFVGMMLLSGCPAPQRQPAPPPPTAPGQPGPGQPMPGPNAPTPVPGAPQPIAPAPGAPAPGTPQAGTQEARRLSTMVNRIQDVKSSSVVISGNTAYVGLNLREDVRGQRVNAAKAEASRIVKRANNRITNVVVTSDPDIVASLQTVANGIRQGRPLSAFANEMADITRRLGPTAP